MLDTSPPSPHCSACGGRLIVFVRLPHTGSRSRLTYFRCERCAHVVIVEE
jgi:DNA-directed RNA polymerase subunit RPC12/RpoP